MRTVAKKEKEIREAVAAAMPTGTKIMCFLKNLFLSHTEHAAFMWVQDCHKKGTLPD